MKKEKFLSLKEAAEISGYAPDYIGQLIRKGKLKGKQMYSGVAWVTTEGALKTYLRDAQGNRKGQAFLAFEYFNTLKRGISAERFFRALVYVGVAIVILIGLVFFYLFSVKIERFLDERSIHQIESLRAI